MTAREQSQLRASGGANRGEKGRTLLDEDERALRVAALLEALGERELGLEVGRLLGDDCTHTVPSQSLSSS